MSIDKKAADKVLGHLGKDSWLYKIIEEYETAKASGQPDELPHSLEERVARIEKWIDFWETIETGWNARQHIAASDSDDMMIPCSQRAYDLLKEVTGKKPSEIRYLNKAVLDKILDDLQPCLSSRQYIHRVVEDYLTAIQEPVSGNHLTGLQIAEKAYEQNTEFPYNKEALHEAICHYNAYMSGDLKEEDMND